MSYLVNRLLTWQQFFLCVSVLVDCIYGGMMRVCMV
jgi:hypothetical protein